MFVDFKKAFDTVELATGLRVLRLQILLHSLKCVCSFIQENNYSISLIKFYISDIFYICAQNNTENSFLGALLKYISFYKVD